MESNETQYFVKENASVEIESQSGAITHDVTFTIFFQTELRTISI